MARRRDRGVRRRRVPFARGGKLEGDKPAMRLHLVSGVPIVALLLSCSALAGDPEEPPKGPSQARELRVTVQLPPASMQTKNLSLFKRHVETLSKGALKVSIFP